MSYMTRAMQSRDPRFAWILERLGYERRDVAESDVVKADAQGEELLQSLRDEYREVVGKKAYHGWDAGTLRKKITEASEDE